MKERKPIFYDSEKVRWRRTRRSMEISGVLLTLLLVYFFVTIAGSVELPSALLPDTRPAYHATKKKSVKLVGRARRTPPARLPHRQGSRRIRPAARRVLRQLGPQ